MKSEGYGWGGRHGHLRDLADDPDEDTPDLPGRKAFPGARFVTQAELLARPLVGVPAAVARCWCGRPQKDSTGRCLQEHEPPTDPAGANDNGNEKS